ncbi:DUF1758 domain-containing protein [Trichonephila clavipes]|nr:DUF1758 domain-containing protein [Trichonephila clavipes]
MTLHKWCSNKAPPIELREFSLDRSSEEVMVKILGMLWDSSGDSFAYKETISTDCNYTKRDVLSQIARIYDPLGLLGPVIAKAKIYSTIALAWINSPSNLLKTFVSNRVSQIQQLSRDFQWQHVPSELNSTDLISRGLDVKTLATSELWFKGTDFPKLSLPSHRTEQNSSDLTDQFYINNNQFPN